MEEGRELEGRQEGREGEVYQRRELGIGTEVGHVRRDLLFFVLLLFFNKEALQNSTVKLICIKSARLIRFRAQKQHGPP